MAFPCVSIAEEDTDIKKETSPLTEKSKGNVFWAGERDGSRPNGADSGFRTGDVNLYTTSVPYLVIDRKQLEGKSETLADTLKKEAGIQIRSSGGTGGFSSISLRGSESSQVMVFIDGIPVSSASDTGVDIGSIPVGDIGSVEIFKGLTPMNFGMASMGGAVNIKTLRSKQGMAGVVSAGAGSYGSKSFSGYLSDSPGKWDYLFSFENLSADNDFEIENDNGTPYNPEDDREEKRRNADMRHDAMLAKAGYEFGDTARIDFQDQLFSKHQGIASYASYNDADNSAYLDTMKNILSACLTADDVSPFLLSTRTRVSHTLKREKYDDRSGKIGLGVQSSKHDTDVYDAGFYAEWKNISNAVEFIAEARNESFKSRDMISARTARSAVRKNLVTGIQDRISFFSDRMAFIPGFRYSFTSDDGRISDSLLESSSFQSDERAYFSPQLGFFYQPYEFLSLKSNIARYYREPSFFELFGDRGFFEGNDMLVSETGKNFDAGFEFRQKYPHEFFDEAFFGATFFYDRIYDLITRTYDARGVGKSVNVPGAVIKGVESSAGLRFSGKTGIFASAVFQDAENLSSGLLNRKLPGRFGRKYTLKAETGNDLWFAYAEYIAENDMYYDSPNLLAAADRYFINTGTGIFIDDFEIDFDIKNIGDERYSDYRLYPSSGRAFLFTVKYRFHS